MLGLNKQEIEYRINNNLINNEKITNSRTTKTILLSNLITLFNLIHIVLLILVLTTGKLANATFIFSIIFNTIISIYQEIKAKIIIDKLKITTTNKINVVREGNKEEILPSEILLDDTLYLRSGDTIPVDAIILESSNVEVDESVITGESDSIIKKVGEKVISGSIIISGECYAKVTSINRDTYANNLIKEASKDKEDSSYLMRQINNILKTVTILIIPIGILLFVNQFYQGNNTYQESILGAVAGIIGMIPDGLVLLTSISLTVGVIKMANKKVIIQRLSGIELLACTDILCLDKTGTITDGSMSVQDLLIINKKYNVENIISAMLQKDGNASDKALYKYFSANKTTLEVYEKIPFSSKRKYSAIKTNKGIYALGALEYITNNKSSDYDILTTYIDKGYRILTLVDCNSEFNKETNQIIAFVIIKDNIRANAKETLEYFRRQDVDVRIISGDDPKTVSNLLKQIDFPGYDKYINGTDIKENSNLAEIVKDNIIFGRVTPEQKKMIVRALKKGNTVGYIGDGVNDILALKESDCGIALASGISAARSVSEVVLTNSDFSVLTNIVNEGRRVVNNIERVASMYLIKTVYSFLISLTCIILSHEYPFYPVQLSLISAICVGIPSFFLAVEPNYTKVEKGFLLKVFRNALPSALCVWINITFLMMMCTTFKIDFDIFRFTIVAVTGYLNLRLLYNVSKPLTKWRKFLVYSCFGSFYLLLIIFHKFFLINKLNFWSFIFIPILVFANNYVVEFLESIYDKFMKYIKKRRSKKNEKR